MTVGIIILYSMYKSFNEIISLLPGVDNRGLNMKIRVWLIAAILVLCQACEKNNRTGRAADRKVIEMIHYWDASSHEAQEALKQIADDYNKSQSNYLLVVSALDHESYKTRILAMTSAMPDIFLYWPGVKMEYLSQMEMLKSFDETWVKEQWDGMFHPSIVSNICTVQGKKAFLPLTQFYVPVFYSKTLFERLGLKPPRNWSEFLKVCEVLKKAGAIPIALGAKYDWPVQYWFDYLLLRTAGESYRQRLMSGKASYCDPEVVRVFRLWKELLDKGYFNSKPQEMEWTQAVAMVAEEKAGMTMMGQWAIANFQSLNKTPEQDFDFFMFPVIDNMIPLTLDCGLDGLAVSRNASNIEGVMEILKLFADTNTQMRINKVNGGICPNQFVGDVFYTSMKLRIKNEMREIPVWALSYDLATKQRVAEAGLAGMVQFLVMPDQYETILKMIDAERKKSYSTE